MTERGAAHEALRAGTRADHERLDALMAGFDLSDAEGYRTFLAAHARALPAIEAALDAGGFATQLADWPQRRRADALAADLAALGAGMPQPLEIAVPAGAAQWGAAYVVEGSRLGGAFLARQVGAGLPRSYLGTAQPPGAWRAFLARLDMSVRAAQEIAEAQETARAAFALFEDAARREMETA